MDSDEIRRRRVERLNRLSGAAVSPQPPRESNPNASGVSSSASGGKPPSVPQSTGAGHSAAATGSNSAPVKPNAFARTAGPANPAVSARPAGSAGAAPPRTATSSAGAAAPKAGTPGARMTLQQVLGSDSTDIDATLWYHMPLDPLNYLQDVFVRARQLSQQQQQEVQNSVITMALMSCTADREDDIFDNLAYFCMNRLKARDIDPEFVARILRSAADNDMDFGDLVLSMFDVVQSVHFGDSEMAALFGLLEAISEVPRVAETLLKLPDRPDRLYMKTKPGLGPAYLAQRSFLGLVVGLNVSPQNAMDLLPSSTTSNAGVRVDEVLAQLKHHVQSIVSLVDTLQLKLVAKLVRLGPSTRRLVLDWFAMLLDMNHATTATNWSPEKCNDMQLLLSALRIMLGLAEPFVKLDPHLLPGQLAKISDQYFASAVGYTVEDETKVLAQQNAPFNAQNLDVSLNFVTECFFLTTGLLHYGANAAIQALNGRTGSLVRYMRGMEQAYVEFLSQSGAPSSGPARDAMKQLVVQKSMYVKCEIAGLSMRLHDPELLGHMLRFSEFVLAFDVQLATGGEVMAAYPRSPPESFASLPEFFLETPPAVANFVMRSHEYFRDPNMALQPQLLLDAAIVFMSSTQLVKNPYLRSKFAEVVYYGGSDVQLTTGGTLPGTFATLFTTSQACRDHLLPALMAVFIDIEHTGRSSQFYEKFSTRDVVSQVLKVLWRDPHYSRQLTRESEQKPDFFVKFVALLLNDATFVLDEALSKLLQLNKLNTPGNDAGPGTGSGAGTGRNSTGAGSTDDPTDDTTEDAPAESPEAAEERLRGQAKSLLGLSASFVDLLRTFTHSVPHIFATPEIVDRFAVMLNYNLAALVGPRCRELKVRNPADIGFNPRQLLTDVVQVYLCMRKEPSFPKALSKDERSYRHENFTRAIQILGSHSLVSPIQLEQFSRLAERTRLAWQETQAEEEEFGDDVPDEFLDPLMFTLMEEPVILPTSRVTIDLSTIKTHLLSDPTDPFNRVPLKIEDVVPNTELKQAIADFRRQKKENAQSSTGNRK